MIWTCQKCGRSIEIPRANWKVKCCPVEGQSAKQSESIAAAKPPKRNWLTALRIDSDAGFGDTVERLIDRFGGKRIEAALKRLGIKCGCGDRKAWLNQRWPY